MGSLVTKLTTNNIELNESNASDVIYPEPQVAKTPTASGPVKTGLFKNVWNYDPRSPSMFLSRTPIAIFRSSSSSKFTHTALNESIESQVDIDILTPEEQDSLDSNLDLATISANEDEIEKILDPRSPITEIARTPIVAVDEVRKKKEDKLMKKLADKLISTAISNNDKECTEDKVTIKRAKNDKNLIFEDEDNNDRYSTPPKKVALREGASTRTPLSCVANTNTPTSRSHIQTSTPKNKFNLNDENSRSSSRIPISARRLH